MNDLISRQAAIDAVNNHFGFSVEEEYGSAVQEVLNALPSVQPRKGKWIRHTRVEPVYSINGDKTWGIKCQCNKCCFATTVVEGFGYYNFCPNCGCRMEEGDSDEKD